MFRTVTAILVAGVCVLAFFVLRDEDRSRTAADRSGAGDAVGHAAPARPHRLFGAITDEKSEPVAGAVVRFGGREAMADERGAYEIRPCPPGPDRLRIEAPGYRIGKPVMLRVGGEQRHDIRLFRGHVFRGRVQDEAGQPAEGVVISIPYSLMSERSNADGAFLIGGLHKKDATEPLSITDPLQRYQPWNGNAADGAVITLTTGARIEGRVLRRGSGEPVAGAVVKVRQAQGRRETTSAKDGRFLVGGLFTGAAILYGSADGLAPARLHLELVAPAPAPVTVELDSGATLSGKVVDEQRRPVAGAVLADASRLDDNPLYAPEYALDGWGRDRGSGTDAEGRFELRGLSRGTGIIVVAADGYVPARVVVEVPGNETIMLSTGGAIEGKLSKPNVVMVLRQGSGFSRTITASENTYRFDGLPPGDYDVICGYASPARVVAGETTRCDMLPFAETPGTILRGTVRVEGKREARGPLHLYPHGQRPIFPRGGLQPGGRYRFDRLRPGRYEMVLKDHGHRTVEIPAAKQEVVLDLVFPSLTLQGQVVGPNGETIARPGVWAVRRDVPSDPALFPMLERLMVFADTDDQGGFLLRGLDDASYILHAAASSYGHARAIVVPRGKSRRIRLGGAGSIRARVYGPDGDAVRFALLVVEDAQGLHVGESDGDGMGLEVAGLSPGAYSVTVCTPAGRFTRRAGVEPGTTLDIRLGVGGDVEIRTEPGALVTLTLPDGRGLPRALGAGLHGRTGFAMRMSMQPLAAVADRSGVVRLRGLSAATYRAGPHTLTVRDGELTRFTLR